MAGEAAIRLGLFLGLFLVIALAEHVLPRRARVQPKGRRWATNWAIVIMDTVILRALALAIPALAVGAALDAQSKGWGLFNQLDWPLWVEFLAALLILDWLIWLQHVVTHKVPILWRLHRVHHADPDFDVSTGIRFHPLSIILSMLIKIGVILLLGPPAIAVLLAEIILNVTAMFNHGNIYLPPRVDAALRLILVTPDMHRVHHSVIRDETDTNFGFNFPWWDRLFGSYRAMPAAGHSAMQIGQMEFRDRAALRLLPLLRQPMVRTD